MSPSTMKKKWRQKNVYKSNEGNWSFFLPRCHRFLIPFCLFFVLLFYFFGIVSFVTTTPDELQFQSQVNLSQINVTVPIRLKFKLYAVFIKRSSRIIFLFVGRQDIVNYWDFSYKVPRKCHKRVVPTIARNGNWEIFVKMSLRDQLIFLADFVGISLLAVFVPLSLPKCFLSVCLPTLFAAVLKFFLLLTTSGVFVTASPNQSTPTRFVTGTICWRKNVIAVLPKTYESAPTPRRRFRPKHFLNGTSTCLEATIL